MPSNQEKDKNEVDIAALRNLQTNCWNWNITTFCKKLGIAEDSYAEKQFQRFVQAADALAYFDSRSLHVICQSSNDAK